MKKIALVSLVLAAMLGPPSLLAEALADLTRELDGTKITYEYTSGRSYNVRFEAAGVSYRYLTGPKPETWWGPFPYQAFRVRDNVYFTSWFEEGYGDHVTLLIDFNKRILYGSAILRGEEVHFHGAKIVKIERPRTSASPH